MLESCVFQVQSRFGKTEKVAVEQFLKCKSTEDELQNAKKQKIDLETSIAALREDMVKGC